MDLDMEKQFEQDCATTHRVIELISSLRSLFLGHLFHITTLPGHLGLLAQHSQNSAYSHIQNLMFTPRNL
jgi:hypothetical protein